MMGVWSMVWATGTQVPTIAANIEFRWCGRCSIDSKNFPSKTFEKFQFCHSAIHLSCCQFISQ